MKTILVSILCLFFVVVQQTTSQNIIHNIDKAATINGACANALPPASIATHTKQLTFSKAHYIPSHWYLPNAITTNKYVGNAYIPLST